MFSKKLAGEASASELAELECLIQEHPGWQYAIQNLEDLWKHQSPNDFAEEEDAYMLHLHRIKEKNIPFSEGPVETPVTPVQHTHRKWYWMAAACIVGIAGFLVFSAVTNDTTTNKTTAQVNEVSTRKGSRSKVQLPDGSVVWLNAGSKLTYDKEYGKEIREVTLTGEGFFDVAKEKEKPFIIHASNVNIKVLGTAFNVRAYPEDKQVETSLLRGSIEVTIKNRPNNKIILSPNEKLIVENEPAEKLQLKKGPELPQPVIAVRKLQYSPVDSTVAETQWVENRLTVRDESLAELATKMERWYDVEIEINDMPLQQKILTVTFEKESIDQALEALRLSLPFRYEKKDNKIIIHR